VMSTFRGSLGPHPTLTEIMCRPQYRLFRALGRERLAGAACDLDGERHGFPSRLRESSGWPRKPKGLVNSS